MNIKHIPNYNKEEFSENEISILNQYFTNVDKPVFGLINMPDVVKGALFARYSRSDKSLRRLFLDEFYDFSSALPHQNIENTGVERATALYNKMILNFGDDSVAQLGGAHIACEQVSNVLTKVIEKGRLASYLEQSTRYIYYNTKINNKYQYVTPSEIQGTELENEYVQYMDSLFDSYTDILNELIPALKKAHPIEEHQTERAWESTIKAKACDIVRGLLPASAKSNLGIYASGQAYEYMLIRMYSSSNSEVILYADLILKELRKIIPSFVTRVDLENRGIAWSEYLKSIDISMNAVSEELHKKYIKTDICRNQKQNEVQLVSWDTNAEDKIVSSALLEYSQLSVNTIEEIIRQLDTAEKIKILKNYCGYRLNRRHKPGRAFEAINYKFEILSDYGAFRDLQRHRMLTLIWQKLSPRNGYVLPQELDLYPKLKEKYIKSLKSANGIFKKIDKTINSTIAQYAIPFAYRIRYEIIINLRQAFHFIELRTQKQGHYSYRKVCMDMFDLINNQAKHSFVKECMKFTDKQLYSLSREDAENQNDNK